MGISDWAVPFNNKESLLSFAGLKDISSGVKVSIEQIYMTDVAIAVHVKMDCQGSQQEQDDNDYKDVKDGLAKLLRFIGSFAEQRGFLLPLIGAIEVNRDSDKRIVERWAADQDWHRGDFSLLCLSGAEKIEEELGEWILGANNVYGKLETVEPLTIDQIKMSLASEIKVRKLSKEHTSLLETVHVILDKEKKEMENAISNWLNNMIQEIERTVEGIGGEESDEYWQK